MFLNKARITINGNVTRTAIILLGKPEAQHGISPAVARITWVLKDEENRDKDYEHFDPPFLLALDKIYAKIRSLKYRYIKDDTLFPDEVQQYDGKYLRNAFFIS